MGNSKFAMGAVVALVAVVVALFLFGVFEESTDGPLENAAEAVQDAADAAGDAIN